MIETIKKVFKHCLTEPDNQTFCPIRIIAVMGVGQYLGTGLANYIQHAAFDPQAFALGLSALIAGIGVALNLKKDTKPGQ